MSEQAMAVVVVYSPQPRVVEEVALHVFPGCTVEQALVQSGVLRGVSREQLQSLEIGIWGQKALGTRELQANDRVEVYRPLKVDPKTARRTRFVKQGAKTAGLFAKRRPGSKPGY